MGSLLIIGYYSQWLKLVELFTIWSPFYPILLDGLVLRLRLETQTHTFVYLASWPVMSDSHNWGVTVLVLQQEH